MSRRSFRLILILILLGFGLLGWLLGQPQLHGNATASPKRSSSAIAITSDGTTLLVVNPDSNSLSLVDPAAQTLIAEIPVGQDPRAVAVSDDQTRAYVANRGSDSVSVLNLIGREVLAELPAGRQPYGLVVSPDGRYLYLAEQGSGYLAILDMVALQPVSRTYLGGRPSGLALSDDGRELYITHLLDKTITILDVSRPYTIFLPLSLSELSLPSSSPADRPLKENAQSTISLWSDSNLVQSLVIGPDGRTAYVPHTRSNTGNTALTFDSTVFPIVSLVDLETRQHLFGQQFNLGSLDPPGVGLPFDAALTPGGDELWVVNAASNDVSVVNLTTRRLQAHIEVADNPRGIVLSPDGATAYVNNTLAGTVSVIDTASYTVTETIQVTDIPLPPLLLKGKRLFHSSDDPRMSNAQWVACSSCHFDGQHDGRTWTFGFAGPRNTTSLLGMIETYPLRWAAEWDESADSEFAIRKENFGDGLISGAMGCDLATGNCAHDPPNQARDGDLDALAAFIDSLVAPLSPGHARGQPLTAAEKRGQDLFQEPDLGCVYCHPPPLYTDKLTHDVGTATAADGPTLAFDTPTLRGLYDSAPYFHNGNAITLRDSITFASPGSEHDLSGRLSEPEIQDLLRYLLALPYE